MAVGEGEDGENDEEVKAIKDYNFNPKWHSRKLGSYIYSVNFKEKD